MATHTPIHKEMGTSTCFIKKEAAPLYFDQGRRRGASKTVSTGAYRETVLDLHIFSLLLHAKRVQRSATSVLLLIPGKHAHGDIAPTPHRDST